MFVAVQYEFCSLEIENSERISYNFFLIKQIQQYKHVQRHHKQNRTSNYFIIAKINGTKQKVPYNIYRVARKKMEQPLQSIFRTLL